MNSTHERLTHGRCNTCKKILAWTDAERRGLRGKRPMRVSKGEAFCPTCGSELARTAAALTTKIPVVRETPIRSHDAERIRAKRGPASPPSTETKPSTLTINIAPTVEGVRRLALDILDRPGRDALEARGVHSDPKSSDTDG